MFSSVDKAIAAAIGFAVTYLVSSGALTADQGVSLTEVLVALGTFAVGGLVTYLVPNKS